MDFHHVPSLSAHFSVFAFCLVYCVWSLLAASWRVVVCLNMWNLLLIGGAGSVPCEGFLVGGFVPAFWWMDLDLVLPEVSPVPCSEFWGVYRFGMALGSLSADVQCCVPVLL